ncbi:tol-pal system protein YbgF [uncultured Roseovarius sp.]|uniref:tol-pal system protein YbgF n=1 Tax=uncultured Roseovarius sp. TaxID=293344 RepID=UPI0026020964|nr:tol-pal system protein YbgF [uncultured Roseovarius sp.]
MRRFAIVLAFGVFAVPFGATAQSAETLADIRQELSVVFVELQRLKRELSTTGGVGEMSGGGPLLDRVNAIESQVQRLTAKTEQLEFRIDRVVEDGTNRVGDLEFRICELEEGCDIANLEPGDTLGGAEPVTGGAAAAEPSPTAPASGTESDDPQMAVGERDDFERAEAALAAGNHVQAAEGFAEFLSAYPGSPLAGRAGLLRGEALEEAGQQSAAARAYLESFSTAPDGAEAPEALFRLGRALGRLGQSEEACVTLGQVAARYPDAAAVDAAQSEMSRLGCS